MGFCNQCFKDKRIIEYIDMNCEETLWNIDGEEYHLWPPYKHCGNDMVFETIDETELIRWLREIIGRVYKYDDYMSYSASKLIEDDSESITDFAPFRNLYDVCESIFNEETEDIVERLCDETLHYREVKDGEEPTGFCEPYSESWVQHCWFDQGHQYLNWDYFSQKVKHSLRFFDTDGFNRLEELEKLDDFFEDLNIYDVRDKQCYRSRVIYDLDKLHSNPEKELGIAPPVFAGHNRFSPSGISYMYLAFEQETATSEVKSEHDEDIYIAEFSIDSEINLLNLTNSNFEGTSDSRTDPFYEEYDTYYACGIELLKAFIHNIPTQILSEFIRLKQYDGFVFDSTKNKNGINIVLFDDTKVTYQTYTQDEG